MPVGADRRRFGSARLAAIGSYRHQGGRSGGSYRRLGLEFRPEEQREKAHLADLLADSFWETGDRTDAAVPIGGLFAERLMAGPGSA